MKANRQFKLAHPIHRHVRSGSTPRSIIRSTLMALHKDRQNPNPMCRAKIKHTVPQLGANYRMLNNGFTSHSVGTVIRVRPGVTK